LFEEIDFEFFFNDYRLPLHNVTFTSFQYGGR